MKWSIYILIIANLLLFAVWYPPTDTVEQTPPAPPLPPGTERLVLLEEYDARALAESEQPVPETPPAAAGDETTSEPTSEPLPDLVQAPPDPDPEPEPAPEPQPEPVAEPEPTPPPEPEHEACLSVGPFADEAAANAVREQLNVTGLDPQQRSESVQQPAGFWVYLSARPSDEARAIVEDLTRRGVEDYFVGRQNFISLGIFSDRTTAERRREEIEGYGYEPQLEQRFRTTSQYWLDLEAPEPDLPTKAQWNDWLDPYSDASPQPKPCQ